LSARNKPKHRLLVIVGEFSLRAPGFLAFVNLWNTTKSVPGVYVGVNNVADGFRGGNGERTFGDVFFSGGCEFLWDWGRISSPWWSFPLQRNQSWLKKKKYDMI
jgi:hypothetical protein